MKPLWTQTLAWMAAVLAAFLLALAGPEGTAMLTAATDALPFGAVAPR